MEKNARREHYQGFKWKRMLVVNLMFRFQMQENEHREHYEREYEIICTRSY